MLKVVPVSPTLIGQVTDVHAESVIKWTQPVNVLDFPSLNKQSQSHHWQPIVTGMRSLRIINVFVLMAILGTLQDAVWKMQSVQKIKNGKMENVSAKEEWFQMPTTDVKLKNVVQTVI